MLEMRIEMETCSVGKTHTQKIHPKGRNASLVIRFIIVFQVDIFQMYVLEFTDREGSPLFHLEHFIEGDYVKYNSNSGFVDKCRLTPQVMKLKSSWAMGSVALRKGLLILSVDFLCLLYA